VEKITGAAGGDNLSGDPSNAAARLSALPIRQANRRTTTDPGRPAAALRARRENLSQQLDSISVLFGSIGPRREN
jgi:hypothetical protein